MACTLTDVMACVPYERHTFEYGPRDYLHQLMSHISSLRGGQQRYLPLLLSKISETIPSLLTPEYAMPTLLNGSRVDEMNSQSHSSGPSSNSTPFGSPPTSAISTTFGFRDLEICHSPPASTFPLSMTSAMQYGDVTVSAPMPQMFQDSAGHGFAGSGGIFKYETG